MLTTRFEEIRMKDDETFDDFYANLNDIDNSSFNLVERIPESKIVRKIIRSLPGDLGLKLRLSRRVRIYKLLRLKNWLDLSKLTTHHIST